MLGSVVYCRQLHTSLKLFCLATIDIRGVNCLPCFIFHKAQSTVLYFILFALILSYVADFQNYRTCRISAFMYHMFYTYVC